MSLAIKEQLLVQPRDVNAANRPWAPNVKIVGNSWNDRIQDDRLATRIFATLWEGREACASAILERIRYENVVLSGAIELRPEETSQHTLQHLHRLFALPIGQATALDEEPLAFIRSHGTRRARAGIPLPAVLQAYRTSHKYCWFTLCKLIKELAHNTGVGLRTTVLLSEYCIDYTDLVSVALTDAFLAEGSLLDQTKAQVDAAAIGTLLLGELPRTPEALSRCAGADIADGRSMVVLLARRKDGGGLLSARDREIFGKLVDNALPRSQFGSLIKSGLEEAVAVVSSVSNAGEHAAHAIRSSMLKIASGGESELRFGIGLDVRKVRELSQSWAEAQTAIRIPGLDRQVSHLAEIGVDAYLRYNADATARRLTPPWAGALEAKQYVRTLQAFADANLNVKACANTLNVHSNTIYNRLNRIMDLTSVDPRSYAGLTRLLTTLALASDESARRSGS